MNESKLCPLRFAFGGGFPFPTQDVRCAKELCEWWHRARGQCVMLVLADAPIEYGEEELLDVVEIEEVKEEQHG